LAAKKKRKQLAAGEGKVEKKRGHAKPGELITTCGKLDPA